MTTKQRTVVINKFAGLKLKEDPAELSRGDLVTAENVDITKEGRVRRRPGYSSVRAVANRKIWSDGDTLLSVEGTNLVKLSESLSATTIRTDLHPATPPDFIGVGGKEIYYSDPLVNGKFVSGTHTDWRVEEPNGYPNLSAGTGSLYEGCHHFAMTYVHDDGRESGCGKSKKVTVSANGSVKATNIPQPSSANIASIRLYLSEADGTVLRLYDEVSVGTTSKTMSSRERGPILTTQFLRPAPFGSYVGFAASKTVVAVSSVLFMSRPFSYHLFDLRTDYVAFDTDITMLASVTNGVYLSADKLYYIDLSQEAPRLEELTCGPAIKGTVSYINAEELGGERDGVLPVWVTEKGIVVGSEQGSITYLTKDHVDIGASPYGATLPREDRGITNIIAAVKGSPQQNNVYVGDTVIAEVKKGTQTEEFNVVDPDGIPLWDDNEPIVYSE